MERAISRPTAAAPAADSHRSTEPTTNALGAIRATTGQTPVSHTSSAIT